eukprot:TRINITY_DN438_c0_g1_i4.p1 TRINITY_DN438_c0_g1~~TRINITY_DN438_c0_g1_i4.p1  ORF type:complete len:603 (+),score=188.36 TRINITY_DN438_c0_g1_i4:193-2001(+)
MKDSEVKAMFQKVDVDGSKELNYDEFKTFLGLLRVRPVVKALFSAAVKGKSSETLTAEDFQKWYHQFQDKDLSLDEAKAVLAKETTHIGSNADQLHATGFEAFMADTAANGIFNPKHATVYQDVKQPFAHYWIASSHNTYLLGDQLAGESSTLAYINALEKGCRCVELDCWDSEKEPIIYHGHTLTSKITFREVLETVRDYGFKTSEYPVILSLEVHCGLEGQAHMAKLVNEILGSAGLLPPVGALPPPHELKKKVLLKGKMVEIPEEEEEDEPEVKDKKEDKKKEEKKKEEKKTKKSGKEEKQDPTGDAEAKSKEPGKPVKEDPKKKKKSVKVDKELSALIHLGAVGFKGVNTELKDQKNWEMCSFSEGKVNALITKDAPGYMHWTSTFLARIYPKGSRFDSSNYNPCPSWNVGAQIVALNYQTGSEPMWLNDGKFQENGRSGYILKPEYMRTAKVAAPSGKEPVKTLTIKILSGHELPKSQSANSKAEQTKDKGEVIDPFIKVSLHGHPADQKQFQTKAIKNNGFNPSWEEEFKFTVARPELDILLFVVMDKDLISKDDLIAQYALPLSALREGFRSVPLKDASGKVFPNASLFVEVRWK